MFSIVSVQDSKLGYVKKTQEDLAEFVKRVRREKGYSLSDVARRSGGRIAKSYVSQIENRYVINPSPVKLKALARGLDVTEEVISAIAFGKSSPEHDEGFMKSTFYRLWLRRNELDDPKVKEFLDFNVRMLLKEVS